MGLLAWEGGWRILKMRDEPTQTPHELPRERLDGMRGGKGKEGATRTRGEARSKPGRAGNIGMTPGSIPKSIKCTVRR